MVEINPKLDERAQNLLKILVNRYIREGQPLGSRKLSHDLGLSPATVRNIMADLEEKGFIFSPHTSAGRIPTAQGYRLFIDTLLQVKPLTEAEVLKLHNQFIQNCFAQQSWERASNLLSEITHLASIVMLPRMDCRALRHVGFLSLSNKRVLVILVTNDHEVQNRVVHTTRHYSATELENATNYLNEAFIGKHIKTVREDLLRDLRETRHSMDKMMEAVIEMADKAFVQADEADDFVMAGQTNLMSVAELSNVEKLRELFEAFNEKKGILDLLDQVIHAQGIKIFIGEESNYKVLEKCSVVTSPYRSGDSEQVVGVLGVIGPTRMAYERVIPVVDLTAKLLGSSLDLTMI